MKRLLAFLAISAVGASTLFAADNEQLKEQERLDSATAVLQALANTPDKGIPQNIAGTAKCVAVVPGLKKGALGWGGQYGQGFATCRTARGWSAPAPIRMAGGSWGLQIGGQSSDIVMLAMDQKGMQDMLDAKFKIGGDASAAAGPVGRHAEAATDWKLNSELLTYSRSKGAFAGISLSGTEVSQNDNDTRALYGRDIPFRTLLNGSVPVPAAARKFVSTVTQYFAEAKK